MPSTVSHRWYTWLLASGAVIALDFATKMAVLRTFVPGEARRVTSFFDLVLSFNDGAAFSFLAGQAGSRWLFTVVAIAATGVIVWLLRRGGDRAYCLGLALILGGALGNVIDRVRIGAVVDFLLFHLDRWYYPAFNVADSAITIGAALLILDSVYQRRRAGMDDTPVHEPSDHAKGT